MPKKKRISPEKANFGNRIKAPDDTNYDRMPILFSLEKVRAGKYCFSSLDNDNKASFGDSIFKRKSMIWNEVINSHKHALGTEKIPVSCINGDSIDFLSEDANTLLALRYRAKAPMVGYRSRQIFYILWFDHDFTLYDHG